MAQIFEFGTAPQAKAQGYDMLVETVVSTDKQILKNHANEDVAYVRGPAIHSHPGCFEFARFENRAKRDAAQAQYMDCLVRKVSTVIYPATQSLQFILAPADKPTLQLRAFAKVEAAKSFCTNNFLPYTVHNQCPIEA